MVERVRHAFEEQSSVIEGTDQGAEGLTSEMSYLEGEEILPDGRYLLYDSGCGSCGDIAPQIEKLGRGWFVTRSLREPVVRDTLTRQDKDWSFEPTLLEVTSKGEQISIYTGLSMKAKLITGVGPVRALQMYRTVQRLSKKRSKNQTVEITFEASETDPKRLRLESVKLLDRKTVLKLGAAGIAASFLSVVPGFSGMASAAPAAAASATTRYKITFYSSANAKEAFKDLSKDNDVAEIRKYLKSQGYKLASKTIEGGELEDSQGFDTVFAGAQYKKGSQLAVVSYQKRGASVTGHMSLLINGGKGAQNFFCDDDRGLRQVSYWPDSREEYRRATSSRTASANATDNITPQGEYTVCSLCTVVVEYIIGGVCAASVATFLSVTGAAAAACSSLNLGAGPCLTVAGAVAGITCIFYFQGIDVPEDICAYVDLC